MNTNELRRGDDLMIFDENGKSLAFATSHTFTQNVSTTEINCKDNGAYGMNLAQKITWEIQTENLYSEDAYDDLEEKMRNLEPVICYWGKAAKTDAQKKEGIDSPTEAWEYDDDANFSYGPAVISNLTVNAASGEYATFSATFTGAGPIKKN